MNTRLHPRRTLRPVPRRKATLLALVTVAVVILVGGIATGCGATGTGSASPSYPPAKATEQAREQQAIATAQAHAPAKPATPPVTKPEPTATLQAGITDIHQGPFPSSEFTVRNGWRGPVGPTWEVVYAGAFTNPDGSAGQGALKIYTVDLVYVGTYSTSNGTSALTVVAVDGALLRLRTDTGFMLTFDLQTHTYS